jgi:2-polyprenyl-6-methoxyphenol hydroxylase-like FAD-dependent oxidoreductase
MHHPKLAGEGMSNDYLSTRCCIAGGGPAGMMLALLLARAGVEVVVLEKHADFLRDFRGDTVHPSTLEALHDLGLLEAFLQRPHDKARLLHVSVGNSEATIADFGRLKTRCGFIAMMPQWEFLDFLRDEAARYPSFHLLLNAEATGLLQDNGRVTGVQVTSRDGLTGMRIDSDLVIAADGRHSQLRRAAGWLPRQLGAPIDVLWMRLPVVPGDPQESGGRIDNGHFMALIHRGSYWQCAYVIAKDGIEAIQGRGLAAFRAELARAAPLFADRVGTLQSWDDIKLLSVAVDRLERWYKSGLLCIGDAAHAMSPIGGVGINLAVQDAIAAANILAPALADPDKTSDDFTPLLAQVQRRRLLPARLTQAVQVAVQNRLLLPVLAGQNSAVPLALPWPLRLLNRYPSLRKWPAYAVGVGFRPERVRSPDAGRRSASD